MKKNLIKIVCNPYTNQIAYYFKNELDEWLALSSSSPLSRQYYTNASMRERAKDIMDKLDEIYNRKNKGLHIFFEGTQQNFDYLQGTVKYYFPDRNIQCDFSITKIAVMGRKGVGKSFLIEGLETMQGCKYQKANRKNYTVYIDECNHAQWYEINGIDLGEDEVERAFSSIKKLLERGLSKVIYCISASSGRMEGIEKNLILKLVNEFPELTIIVVLTQCYKGDAQTVVDEIKKMTNQIEVIQTLSKRYKTRIKNPESGELQTIEPFGLDLVFKSIFEGR